MPYLAVLALAAATSSPPSADGEAALRRLQPPEEILRDCPAAPSPEDGWTLNPHLGKEPGFLLLAAWILNAHPAEEYEGDDLVAASLALRTDGRATVILAGYAFASGSDLEAAIARARTHREPAGRYADIRRAWYPEHYAMARKGDVLLVLQTNATKSACFDRLREWLEKSTSD
jgi:hypothetical protein